jgi:hypothetical protein
MRYLLVILVLLVPATASAQEECETQPDSFWICTGDKAWADGYLLPPDILDLRQVKIWEEKAALVPELTDERDLFQSQRDKALEEIELLDQDYEKLIVHSDLVTDQLTECQVELDGSYDTWDIALISSATGVGALIAGLLVGALAI